MADLSVDDVMRAVADLRREMQGEIAELRAALAALQARQAAGSAAEPEVGGETLAILAAAITAHLGLKVRIRSARLVPPPHEGTSPWAQHGRVFVQSAAHTLRHSR